MKGMEYTDRSGDAATLERIYRNDEWALQQKMDGTRTLIHLETLTITQRNGNPLKHTAATQWIPHILHDLSDLELSGTANTILDCELMIENGQLWVFDVIDPWRLHEPMIDRARVLEMLPVGNHLNVVSTAWTEQEKRSLVEKCADREGVVAKHILAPYSPGKRVEHVLKFKNIHTGMLTVTRLSEQPLSAQLGILTDDGPHTVANASMIGKDPTIRPGDVVEVNYLNWTGTSLIQPRIVRKRADKNPEDCTIEQFSTYSREAI